MPNKSVEFKRSPVFITKIDEAQGIVEAIVSTMGVRDYGDDVIENGAYAKTIVERSRKVRVLDAHNSYSVTDVIGKPLSMREIGRDELPVTLTSQFPDATGALMTVTQYALSTVKGRDAFNLIRDGFVDEYSIGYEPIQMEYRKVGDTMVRFIKEIKLWEYSPVVWGMNPATATVSAKNDTPSEVIVVQEENIDLAAAMDGALTDIKAGRVLSESNARRLREACAALMDVLSAAGMGETAQDDADQPEKSLGTEQNNGTAETPVAEPDTETVNPLTTEAKRLLQLLTIGKAQVRILP